MAFLLKLDNQMDAEVSAISIVTAGISSRLTLKITFLFFIRLLHRWLSN
jgi:hypothetical protein